MTTTNLPTTTFDGAGERIGRPWRQAVAWTAVGAAVAASALLAVQVLDDDAAVAPLADAHPTYSVEHGSITAIDHAAAAAAPVWFSVEHGSIAAIDHAFTTADAFPADTGSVAAIDHDAGDTQP